MTRAEWERIENYRAGMGSAMFVKLHGRTLWSTARLVEDLKDETKNTDRRYRLSSRRPPGV